MFKLRNRLNKSTFEIISYLKSWGLFKDELVTYLEEKREDRKVSRIHLNSIK